jgi:GNAT superfamily N-acetyltransferase
MDGASSAGSVIGTDEKWDVGPMTTVDAVGAYAVVEAAIAAQDEAGHRPPRTPPSDAEVEQAHRAHLRFVQLDGPGAWVAESDGHVIGMAESVRRGGFWGLSMLFVHPDFQSRGVGAALLDAALTFAVGASQRMIQSSSDPRAMRRYFLAGLAMHPTAELEGRPDRGVIPPALPGREGEMQDLDLVASVEEHIGRSRTEDVGFAMSQDGSHLDVVDTGPGRGWVLWNSNRLDMLGATDVRTAATLLWRYLGRSEGPTRVSGLTAAQQWAFAVAHDARLSVRVDGALFVDGMTVPTPWIPSGWFF